MCARFGLFHRCVFAWCRGCVGVHSASSQTCYRKQNSNEYAPFVETHGRCQADCPTPFYETCVPTLYGTFEPQYGNTACSRSPKPQNQYCGGWGLFSQIGQPTPRFNIFGSNQKEKRPGAASTSSYYGNNFTVRHTYCTSLWPTNERTAKTRAYIRRAPRSWLSSKKGSTFARVIRDSNSPSRF